MKYKVVNGHFKDGYENLESYCNWLKRKNSVVLFKLENYAKVKLSTDPELAEIRNLILDVSNDISRLPSIIVIEGEEDARL